MQIEKQGYKYTEEFGYIPEDWEVTALGDNINYFKGYAFKSSSYTQDGTRIIRVSDMSYDDISDSEQIFISKLEANELSKYALKENDVIITTVGSKPPVYTSLVGRAIQVKQKDDGSLLNQNAVCLRIKNKLKQKFLFYIFKQKYYMEFLEQIIRGNANQGSITLENLFELPVLCPPVEEQEQIAEVLGDVDSLIDKTQQLINKKKDLKTATMQKLLTPKDDWEKYIIGQMGSTYSGLSGKNKDAFGNGESLYIPFLNIMNNPVIDTKTLEKVCINTNESQNLCLKDDLFFNTSSETPEEVGMCATLQEEISNLYLNSFCFGYRLKPNINVIPKFLVYLFRGQYGRKIMQTLAQGSTRYNLPKDKFMEYEVVLPKFEEQKRTVAILSDMDSEIEALEKELNKYKDLKTGMMQQLLTGKVRLI